MTQPLLRQPQTVVLSSTAWVDELAGELIRLGFERERARSSARTMLRRILARGRWPAECFVVDDQALIEGP